MFSGSRLSGMLAALAGVTSSGLSATTTTTKPPDQPEASTSSSAAGPSATVERRRSQRLSAKSAAALASEPAEPGPSNPLPPPSLGSSAEPPTSLPGGDDGFGDNAEFTADFTDDDVEAEVFDDEMDPDNVSTEKTVTLSVADGLCFICVDL
jgi:E3 ubiquitin-protein ligase TRIP12